MSVGAADQANAGVRPMSIDVYAVARRAVASMGRHLVTRPTGRAVRAAIEQRLAGTRPALVLFLDLRRIQVIDFSCADEVVAKLVLRYLTPDRPRNVFFLLRAVETLHRHAVEEVLSRHRLAAPCDVGGRRFELLGHVGQAERGAWTTLERRGRVASGTGAELGAKEARILRGLADRRLAYVGGNGEFLALSALTSPAT